MRLCSIEGCKRKHEAKGYCKRHYKSFVRHGNPIQVDINDEERRVKKESAKFNENLTTRGTVRWAMTREGICSVEGCVESVKSRGLCEKHYSRKRRLGSVKLPKRANKQPRRTPNQCLVIGCERRHYQSGYCNTHVRNKRELGTPYRAKIIRLCGVKGCNKNHLAKGLCSKHYNDWQRILEDNGMK